MSLADDVLNAGAVDILLHVHGESVTYKPRASDDVSLTGIVGNIETDQDEIDEGTERAQRTTLSIARDPDGTYGGVASPTERDTVEIGGVEWAVTAVEMTRGNMARLILERGAAVDLSGSDYEG